MRDYLSVIKAEEDKTRDKRILDLYLACYRYEDIAKETGYADKSGVAAPIDRLRNGKVAETQQPPASLTCT